MHKARRNALLVTSSTGVNAFGDVLLDLYVSWSLGSATGNVMNGVYVIATSVGFRAVLAFLLGSHTDRHKKKPQMVCSHVLSLAAVTAFAIAWNSGLDRVAVGLAFVLVNDFSNELLQRSRTSMMADMLPSNDFMRFQNVNGVVARVVSTGGAALAGLLIDGLPFGAVVGIDVLTYLASLAAVLLVDHAEGPVSRAHTHPHTHPLRGIAADVRFTAGQIAGSRLIRSFVAIMVVLNLAYGFMPSAFPLLKSAGASAGLYGTIRAGVTVGEVVGLVVATRLSRHVSRLFGVGLLANAAMVALICATGSPAVLVAAFSLYGLFDSLTQPLFSYVVSRLDPENRGKILGGIDGIIMLPPSLGILLLSGAFEASPLLGAAALTGVFLLGFAIFLASPEINHVRLGSARGSEGARD